MGGAVLLARLSSSHVSHHQLQRPTHRERGPVALTQGIAGAVHPHPFGQRTGDHHQGSRGVGGGDQPQQREGRVAGRLHRGQDDREGVRRAAGHDGIDGHLLHRRLTVVGRHHADEVLRIAAGGCKHVNHPLGCRGHHRQAVGESSVEQRLEGVLQLAYLELPRPQPAGAPGRPGGQSGGHHRITGQAGAPGPALGKPVEVQRRAGAAGQLSQPSAVQPFHPVGLRPAIEQHHGGDGVGIEPRRELEVRVELGNRGQMEPARLGLCLVCL